MGGGKYAILDVAQHVVELGTDGTRLTILADDVALLVLQVVDTLDGGDDSCGAACAGLFKGGQLFLGYLATLHLEAKIHSQLHQALVGDAGQDRGALGSHIGVVLDAEEVGGTTLVDILLLLGVEIELRGVAVLVGYVVGLERSGIVATHLIDTGAEGSGTVVVAHDDVGVG